MSSFGRVWAITVGTLRIPMPLRVSFEIKRSRRPKPAEATAKIYNLTRDHQAAIERAIEAQVIIEAGYDGDRGAEILFSGELFRARTARSSKKTFTDRTIDTDVQGVDAITEIEARDGGAAYQRARIAQSFEPGVSVSTVLRACADALGVGRGNVDQAAELAELDAGGATYPEGTVLSGQAARELTRILQGLGLRWSVQLGALQILRRGQALAQQAVRLSPDTGLVGTPDVGTRGRVKIKSLLTSDLWPGRIVLLQSKRTEGRYVVDSTKYTGDSHAEPWYAECELEAPDEAA